MNRRDLIKTSLLAAGALSALNLSGCSNKKDVDIESNNFVPKQTSTYSITAPLPFDFQLIDEMKELNTKLKKSKIKTLYNSIPFPLAKRLETFHSHRGINKKIESVDDFLKYVNYAQKQGFDFVYTLNSPKPFSDTEFEKRKKELFNLLDKLKDGNVNKFKIANTQLLNILPKRYSHFKFQASTSFEFRNINQYINLLKNYPNIELIDIAIDENRNFKFLKTLKTMFPDTKLELIVNEPCLRGCPARISHCATNFYRFDCMKIIEKNWIEEFCKSGVIYPWNLDYYSAMNINRFKLLPTGFVRADIRNIEYLKEYLELVENGAENYSAKDFFEKVIKFSEKPINTKAKLSEILAYFPDIKYFIENGDKCNEKCGVDCSYCVDCAKKLKKIIS